MSKFHPRDTSPFYTITNHSLLLSPFRFTWLGGSRFASNREELGKLAITRQEYQEYGSGWAGRRFAGMI